MLKKIFILFRLGRKLARSDILAILSKFKKPPLGIKIIFQILSFSFSAPNKTNLNENEGARLSKSLQSMGTTFIKLGQFLVTRPDIIGDNLAKQLEARAAQEKFNDTVVQLKQIFVDMVGGPFGDVLSVLGEMIAGISIVVKYAQDFGDTVGGWFSFIGEGIAKLGMLGKVLKTIGMLAVVVAAYKAFSALASITIVGPVLGMAAAAAVMSAGYAALSSADADDATFEGGGYGKRTLLEEGRITRFNDNDTVIAGTRIGTANDMMSEGAATPQTRTPAPQPIIIDNTVVHDSFQASNYYNGPRSREKANSAIFD